MTAKRDAKGRFRSTEQYELVWWDGYGGYREKDEKKREPVDIVLFGTDRFVCIRQDGSVERLEYQTQENAGSSYYLPRHRKLVRVSA